MTKVNQDRAKSLQGEAAPKSAREDALRRVGKPQTRWRAYEGGME